MSIDRDALLLYAVTAGPDSIRKVEEVVRAGVTAIQLREKEPRPGLLEDARYLRELTRSYGVLFIVNDDIDLALECGADGVHLGQGDMPAREASSRLNGKILGVSVQTVEQALEAQSAGADYLGVGAVFPTSTKQDADLVSHDTLMDICAAVSIPVVAIGGISVENVLSLKDTGIAGIAVVSAIFSAPDPAAAVKKLRRWATSY